jgi:hypothetical protein
MYYSELTLGIIERCLNQNNAQPALNYVLKEESKPSHDIFKNGIWSNRCFEYGKWHGPFQHQITFNFDDNTFDGYGEDRSGPFFLAGSFSKETREINIVISYMLYNSEFELDNQYCFPLTWNEKQSLFEGLKYEPFEYAGFLSGLFEMSFVRDS